MNSAGETRQRLNEALILTGSEDHSAFREVYRLTSGKLFGICLRICGDRQAAEDVLHEVYLLIWKRAGAYDPGRGSPISWLASIARNRAIDWRRANPAVDHVPIDDVFSVADVVPLASERLIEDEDGRRLQNCLDSLEERQRTAIYTAFFEGVTYAELAEREGVPLGTMKSWVRRGLIWLRGCLDG